MASLRTELKTGQLIKITHSTIMRIKTTEKNASVRTKSFWEARQIFNESQVRSETHRQL